MLNQKLIMLLALPVLLLGCLAESGSVTATPTAVAQTTETDATMPTLAATTSPSPTATVVPATTTAVSQDAPSLAELIATVKATMTADAYDDIQALMLDWPQAERPLAAVHSVGFRNFDLEPVPDHFVAIYGWADGQWQEVASQPLAAPDIVPEQAVASVNLAPGALWLAVDGYVGAHSGTFDLLQFDGRGLQVAASGFSDSPGAAYFEDLNGDGRLDLILTQHDHYVFCYACGVRYLNFRVLTWDDASQTLREVALQPLPADQQDHPAYTAVARAVELAQADLWPAAQVEIVAAQALAADSSEPLDTSILDWNATLIDLYVNAWQDELASSPYLLLTQIFYGDYAAALDIVRGYEASTVFATPSPLIQATAAAGNEQWLADYVLQQTNAAIAAQPNLAAAYFFRAWGNFLQNPADPQIADDLAQAAALAPEEPLFAGASQPAVQRIQFAAGATSAQVSGSVTPDGEDVYVLTAEAGQRLTADLFPNDDSVRLTVRDEAGDFVMGQVTPTLWVGLLPMTGDYLIRVRGEETAVGPTNYTLNVNIPARISFEPGAVSATVSGSLETRQSVDYILRAQAGQTMDVVIESDTSNVLLTIVGADGIPLTNGLMSGATSWRGELPATQDYILRAIGTFDDTTYTLTVTIE